MQHVNLTLNLASGPVPLQLYLNMDKPDQAHTLKVIQSGKPPHDDVFFALVRLLRAGDTFVDVGGNIGILSMLAGHLVGPEGRVLAVEPAPENADQIEKNIELNGLSNVTLVRAPASDEAEEVTFHLNADNSGGHALWDPGEFPENVKSKTEKDSLTLTAQRPDAMLADAIANGGFGTPRVVKMDVEGCETKALRGFGAWVTDHKIPYFIVEFHAFALEQMGSSQGELRELMEAAGYCTYALVPGRAFPIYVPPKTAVGGPYICNLLFASDDDISAVWSSCDPYEGLKSA